MQNRIENIASILFDQGVRNIVISPGSRNAPLTLAFVSHGGFNISMIYDERSAGFIALGQAIASKAPSVLICTSGTAGINYYPAICEAFYQKTPLIILTADRPLELIDQGDGQSIRQQNVFHNHILKSYQLLPDYESKQSYSHLQQVINEATLTCSSPNKRGPVHINIPFREPFYPTDQEQKNVPYKVVQKIEPSTKILDKQILKETNAELKSYHKILVFKGQEFEDSSLESYNTHYPIAKDVMGDSCSTDGFITMHDFLFSKENNVPELVITIGQNILSKSLKTVFRTNNIVHWHVGTEECAQDVFQKLTKHIACTPSSFFESVTIDSKAYRKQLFDQELKLRSKSDKLLNSEESTEFTALYHLTKSLPIKSNIHISNSMPIRYMNHLQFLLKQQNVYCNRGTSGIDGSISTAIGIASLIDEKHYMITGDLSFFYDRNGLWNGIDKQNVSIILLNNHGGGIFNMINGPSNQTIDQSYFTTPQSLNAQNTANDFGMDYYRVNSTKDLKAVLKDFINHSPKNGQILEIETDMAVNTVFYKAFLKEIRL